jgi:hypothetical protein
MKTLQAMFWAALAATVFIIWGLFFSGPAHATPAQEQDAQTVCQLMDSYAANKGGVTDQEMTNIIYSMMYEGGLTPQQAGETLAKATTSYCPEWGQAFIDYFAELDAGEFTILDDGTLVYTSTKGFAV